MTGFPVRLARRALGAATAALALAAAAGCGGRRPGIAAPAPCAPAPLGQVRVEGIAPWRGAARGAYSIIHDDTCGWGLEGIPRLALPALERRGLRAGLAAIAGDCEERALWPMLAAAEARGHEVLSHSYTHARVTPENAPHEVAGAKAALERHLRTPVRFFAFPYDQFTPETVAAVAAAGHWGARAGNRDDNDGFGSPPLNPAEPGNEMAVEFDVWPRAYSAYGHYRDLDVLDVHVWNAMERGGWAVRELHTVMDDGPPADPAWFGPIRLSTYERHLDFVAAAARGGQLWVDTPSAVLAYRRARRACGVRAEGTRVVFEAAHPECRAYATALSVVVALDPAPPGLEATQAGRPVPVAELGPGRFSVTAHPTGGAVELRGCTHAGPRPEAAPLGTRPSPAASVCELSAVAGDPARRRVEEAAAWTWYPESASGSRRAEGAPAAARLAGAGLRQWSGLTLGFVDGEGGAACFDARGHRGVRFRLKGTVSGDDELDGKALFSVITAETRARRHGGDLPGAGGHFHRVLPVGAEWRWFEIPWDGLAGPTWGDSVGLARPAPGKLLALEWGVSDRAARFELLVDDVELY